MKIQIDLAKNAYDVVIAQGTLQQAGALLNLKRNVLILTDTGVPADYAQTVADFCEHPVVVSVEQGEASKSLPVWEQLLGTMKKANFTRGDAVVAVGGGVVGDLAGFAAASFMRGIDFYNIPTTLLSQVDSSVGGKTAVNFGAVKNMVGAFYQPKKVLIDPAVLQTLPPRQMASGMAEIIKMALCFDREMFEAIENSPAYADLETWTARSVRLKADVVEQDEKENGLRRVLNFGHTIGHGIEAQGGLYHGECVALGMLPMCESMLAERLKTVFKKYNLPCTCQADAEAVIRAAAHDKKRTGDTLRAVFVPAAGTYEIREISMQTLEEMIRNYCQ